MFMRAQRVRGGGSRIEMQDIKWTAEGAVKGLCYVNQVFCDVRHTSVVGNMKVFRKSTGRSVKQGGTAGGIIFVELVPDRCKSLSGIFFMQ